MRSRRALAAVSLGAPLALLAAVLVVALLRPRGPELVPYISPPLDARGARLHIVVPREWEAVHPFSPAWPGSSSHVLLFMHGEPMASVPAWLRRWMPVHKDRAGHMQRPTVERGGNEAQLTYSRTDRAACVRTQVAITRSMGIG